MTRPRHRRARRVFGVLLGALSVAVFVGVIVHVCGEGGQEADDHLPYLLAALLAAITTLGLSISLLLPRPPGRDLVAASPVTGEE